MNPEYFRTLYDYSCWARDKLFAAMEGLSEDEYTSANPSFNYGSLYAVLTHCLSAELSWFSSFSTQSPPQRLSRETTPTLAALKSRWLEEESKIRRYLDVLSDAELAQDFPVRRRDKEPLGVPLALVMSHVLNHGTQHRSEAAEMLTAIGRSPGELDLIFYLLAKGQPAEAISTRTI